MRPTRKAVEASWTGRAASFVDRVVGVFDPARAFKRQQLRFALSGAYAGAGGNRLLGGWSTTSGSADADILDELPELRARSRELLRNDDGANAIVEAFLTNVIGCGMRPQSRVNPAEVGMTEDEAALFQEAAERAFKGWCDEADVTGCDDFYGLQRLMLRSILENGEVLVVPRYLSEAERRRPGREYSLALQLIESDRLDTPSGLIASRAPNGNEIRGGVEIDTLGRPVAYWIRKKHPGDFVHGTHTGAEEYDRVAAYDMAGHPRVLHLFPRLRVGQTRGVPLLAPVLGKFHHLSEYMEAELVAARVAACFAAIVTQTASGTANFSAPATGVGPDNEPLAELFPGMIHYLRPGESVEQLNPSRPGQQFAQFVERTKRDQGAGVGLPYEVATLDFSKTNFSSARAALIAARARFQCVQRWFAWSACRPIYALVMREALLRDELPVLQLDRALLGARWIGPAYHFVRPDQEVRASLDAIAGGLSTHADEAGALGRDWEEVFTQRQREERKRTEMGLSFGDTDALQSAETEDEETDALEREDLR